MKQRYNIIETYFGLYDEKHIIACTNYKEYKEQKEEWDKNNE